MKAELAAWNDGQGFDLESWVGCAGNFKPAVGYASIFWPKFVEFENYVFQSEFSESSVRGFETQAGSTPKSVEWVINHIHFTDIQHYGCEDASKDKLIAVGNILGEIHDLKLKSLFPDTPCKVEFYKPEDEEDLIEYQLSFWQLKHDPDSA